MSASLASGYVSVGFPSTPGSMVDATAMILQTCTSGSSGCTNGAKMQQWYMSGKRQSGGPRSATALHSRCAVLRLLLTQCYCPPPPLQMSAFPAACRPSPTCRPPISPPAASWWAAFRWWWMHLPPQQQPDAAADCSSWRAATAPCRSSLRRATLHPTARLLSTTPIARAHCPWRRPPAPVLRHSPPTTASTCPCNRCPAKPRCCCLHPLPAFTFAPLHRNAFSAHM